MDSNDINAMQLTITLQGHEGAIGIRKNTYKFMGCPRYVGLRISYRQNALMLYPCKSKDLMSFEAPQDFLEKNKINFRMYSQRFVKNLLRDNCLDTDCTYVLSGQFSEKHKNVIFPICTATPMHENNFNELNGDI